MGIILLIVYILVLIFLIINFVKCLKNKAKWIKLFIVEIVSIIVSTISLIYYNSLPGYGFMPGLSYIFEFIICFGAMFLYGIIFAVTLITKLILFLFKKKKQGKNYFPKIAIIIAIILLIYGFNTLILDLKNDFNLVKTNSTIIDYNNIHPIVEYSVDSEIYTAEINIISNETLNSKLNDTIEIHYIKNEPSKLGYLSYYENVYIPCFVISLLLFILGTIKTKK